MTIFTQPIFLWCLINCKFFIFISVKHTGSKFTHKILVEVTSTKGDDWKIFQRCCSKFSEVRCLKRHDSSAGPWLLCSAKLSNLSTHIRADRVHLNVLGYPTLSPDATPGRHLQTCCAVSVCSTLTTLPPPLALGTQVYVSMSHHRWGKSQEPGISA